MDTLKLQTNIPETIALAYADGKPIASQFGGDQIMFTLTDGRRAFFAPFVAKKISDAGIQAGELFSVCKREVIQGSKRLIQYEIQTDVDRTHVAGAAELPAPARSTGPVLSAPAAQRAAAHAAAVPRAAGCAIDPAVMVAAGCAAIDAVLEVEKYAQARGLTDFSFGADNIQKMWVTFFLEGSRKSGRT